MKTFGFVGCGRNLDYLGNFQERFIKSLWSISELNLVEQVEYVFVDYASDELDNGWMDKVIPKLPTNFPIKFVRVKRENLCTEEQRNGEFPEVVLRNIGIRHFAQTPMRASVSCDSLFRRDFIDKLIWLSQYHNVYHNKQNELMIVSSRTQVPIEEWQGKPLEEIWGYIHKNQDYLATEQLHHSFWGSVGDFQLMPQLLWERLYGYDEKLLKSSWLDMELALWVISNHIPIVDMLNRCGKCFFHLEHGFRHKKLSEFNKIEIRGNNQGVINPDWGKYKGELEVITNAHNGN